MDWVTWLARTGLDPTLVNEYGVAFTLNELERDDIPYFNHELLQSMGISVAKHRLQILKLAGKYNSGAFTVPGALNAAVKRTKRCLSKHLIERWKESVAKRNKRPPAVNWKNLLTIRRFASPKVEHEVDGDRRIEDGYRDSSSSSSSSPPVEEIRWDAMFQNLKPN